MSENINLYNKYRPHSLKSLIGQDLIKKLILQTFKKQKLVQSFLFFGPHGTGKTSVARILAKAWNCLNFDGKDICNECENCQILNQDKTIDIQEIDAASNNGVDFIRELVSNTQYVPLDLKKKVYIIDEAHNLSSASWNVLLKVIEEPPEYVIFIFLTTNVQKIIPTIVSRCQKYNFSFLNKEQLIELISYVSEKEKKIISENAKEKIAFFSEGSARQCLTHLEKLFLIYENEIDLKKVEEVFCLTDKSTLFKFLDEIFSENFQASYEIIENLHTTGKNLLYFFSDLLDIFSDFIIFSKTKSDKYLRNVSSEEAEKFQEYSKKFLIFADNLAKSITEFDSFKSKFQWAKITIFKLWNVFNLEKSESISINLEEEKIISAKTEKLNENKEIIPKTENLESTFESKLIENEFKTESENIPKNEIEKEKKLDQIKDDVPFEDPKFLHDDSMFKMETVEIFSEKLKFFLGADFSKKLDENIVYALRKSDREKSKLVYEKLNKYVDSEQSFPELVNLFRKINSKFGTITSDKTVLIIFDSPADAIEFSKLFKSEKIRNEIKQKFLEDLEWFAIETVFLPKYLKLAKSSKEKNLEKENTNQIKKSKVYSEILDILDA